MPKAPDLYIAIKVGAPGPLALEDPGLTHVDLIKDDRSSGDPTPRGIRGDSLLEKAASDHEEHPDAGRCHAG